MPYHWATKLCIIFLFTFFWKSLNKLFRWALNLWSFYLSLPSSLDYRLHHQIISALIKNSAEDLQNCRVKGISSLSVALRCIMVEPSWLWEKSDFESAFLEKSRVKIMGRQWEMPRMPRLCLLPRFVIFKVKISASSCIWSQSQERPQPESSAGMFHISGHIHQDRLELVVFEPPRLGVTC